jgi:two-component system, LytTR family, response regulator
MKIRAMIVDDEPLARQRLRSLLDAAPDVEIAAECATGAEAVDAILKSPPELLFLDIQMPEVDGFQVLAAVGAERVPAVVFVTAYDRFALRAFEANALDYLLKPFDDDRCAATLQRARARIRERHDGDEVARRLQALLDQVRGGEAGRPLRRLGIRSGLRTVFVRTEEIDWIEADGNYVRLHVGDRTHLHRETISRLEAALDPERFCRIHRGILVNVDRIRAVESLFKGDHVVILHDGTRLSAGRSHRAKLVALWQREP